MIHFKNLIKIYFNLSNHKPYRRLMNLSAVVLKKNYLVTIAIGKKSLDEWTKYAKPLCLKYCKKYSLGLIVIVDDLIDKKDLFWKKATWQKMLIGSYLKSSGLKIRNICILDVDILINPNSPNIFKHHDEKKISLVSQVYNLPYDLNFIRKRISFNRNKFYPSNQIISSYDIEEIIALLSSPPLKAVPIETSDLILILQASNSNSLN